MKTINLLMMCLFILSLQTKAQTVTDVDGNVYKTITIGKQVWMAENLKVTHYRNGKPIPLVTDNNTAWDTLNTPAYCYYNNDKNNIAIYGCLYNIYAMSNSSNICPKGWHIPSDDEWMELATYLGGARVAGGKMKEAGTKHWTEPNEGATNESGFTALPAGIRGRGGRFWNYDVERGCCFWWSSIVDSIVTIWTIRYSDAKLTRNESSFKGRQAHDNSGFSIRCIKDK